MAIKCNSCDRYINRNDDSLSCSKCASNFHVKCAAGNNQVLDSSAIRDWTCGCDFESGSDYLNSVGVANIAHDNPVDNASHCKTCFCDSLNNRSLLDVIANAVRSAVAPLQAQIGDLRQQINNLCKSKELHEDFINTSKLGTTASTVMDARPPNQTTGLNESGMDHLTILDNEVKRFQNVKSNSNQDEKTGASIPNGRPNSVAYVGLLQSNLESDCNVIQDSLTSHSNPFMLHSTCSTKRIEPRITTINGTSTSSSIKAVKKRLHLHIFNLEPSVTEKNIEDYINNLNLTVISIEKLKSKHPTYSSFHISGTEENTTPLYKSEVWPEGARVKRFFIRHAQPPQNTPVRDATPQGK